MTNSRMCRLAMLLGLGVFAAGTSQLHASAYGTLCNFDTVNDTEEECHGFEIELEDCHSSDITRTYNYNHYGVPEIEEDSSDPAHPKCHIRWKAVKNPDGTWSAYTAVPSGPIDPTNGHQFTNPNVNFGGEHFGVSYRNVPTNVRYFWLVDRGGVLVRGAEEVKISTPTFTYNPGGGNVVARVEPPEPVEVHMDEFGPAVWVKSIKTTTHSAEKVELRDLRSDDPDDPDDVNWQNGEPAEVEVEWEILQEEFDEDGEGEGDPEEGAAEDLGEDGDDIITRRWEFYAYTGPFHPESHEAIADKVAEDGVHGVGVKTDSGVEYDLENTIVVGDYLGAQMAAFDVDPEVELCDHLQDGEEGEAYPDRLVVIPGSSPFTATLTGDLPAGMSFDAFTGILSGTPAANGEWAVTVEASDAVVPSVSRTYNLRVAAAGAVLAPQWTIDANVGPAGGGSVIGAGVFGPGDAVTVEATPNPGYRFYSWTELGVKMSTASTYNFTAEVNRQLVAHFQPMLAMADVPAAQFSLQWPADAAGWTLQESTTLAPESWADSTLPVTENAGMKQISVNPAPGDRAFFRLYKTP